MVSLDVLRCAALISRAELDALWSRNRAAKSHLADETKKPMCKYAALPGGCYRTNPVRRKTRPSHLEPYRAFH